MVRSVMAVLALIIFPGLMAGQEPVQQAPARATLEEVVRFDFDESTITAGAEQLLRAKLPILRDSVEFRLLLEGHADERGSIEYNLALGGRRAESVRDFLVGLGISADRLTTTSFGEERPLLNRERRGGLGPKPSGRVRDHRRPGADIGGRGRADTGNC